MGAIGPRPLSNRDSITTPDAGPVSIAFNSSISACNKILSNKASIPSPVKADTCAKIVSPPQSSGITSCLANSCLTRSGSAFSLSILLIAIIIGTLAAFACVIASSV